MYLYGSRYWVRSSILQPVVVVHHLLSLQWVRGKQCPLPLVTIRRVRIMRDLIDDWRMNLSLYLSRKVRQFLTVKVTFQLTLFLLICMFVCARCICSHVSFCRPRTPIPHSRVRYWCTWYESQNPAHDQASSAASHWPTTLNKRS